MYCNNTITITFKGIKLYAYSYIKLLFVIFYFIVHLKLKLNKWRTIYFTVFKFSLAIKKEKNYPNSRYLF